MASPIRDSGYRETISDVLEEFIRDGGVFPTWATDYQSRKEYVCDLYDIDNDDWMDTEGEVFLPG